MYITFAILCVFYMCCHWRNNKWWLWRLSCTSKRCNAVQRSFSVTPACHGQ